MKDSILNLGTVKLRKLLSDCIDWDNGIKKYSRAGLIVTYKEALVSNSHGYTFRENLENYNFKSL